jgi:acetyltransferase-like isoleucine patch superfamily enzyme
VVAAGAVVTKDLFPGKVYAGVPARELKTVPTAQLLRNQDFGTDKTKK